MYTHYAMGNKRKLYLRQNTQTGFWTHAVSYSLRTGFLSPGVTLPRCELTTQFHLAQRLKISGIAPLLPLHAFIAWARTNLSPIDGNAGM